MDDRDFLDLNDLRDLEEIENLMEENISRELPDRSNPLEDFDDIQFKSRYRFSKETVRDVILSLVHEQLWKRPDQRGSPMPPLLQLLTAIRFYSTGHFQISNGDLHGLSQPTVSRIVHNISNILSRDHLGTYVRFPNNLQHVKQRFFSIRGFPEVIGCVDGTHIPINCPQKTVGEIFQNRKGYFSLNVQVTGPDFKIYDLVCRWPGSTHDSRIFNNSALKVRLDNQELRGILLGDSGYPQLPYLFTPVLGPGNAAEERYNLAHKSTRNTVERLFGIWKRRFPCLRSTFEIKLENTVATIIAVAILHNIAIDCNDDFYFPEDEHEQQDQQPENDHFSW